ncbi:MAG TPA: hypothetical protein VD816_06065, partial [Ohtaekwangia sp.]|nr:hypothetical protein [Ohtaekwangia sp.]
ESLTHGEDLLFYIAVAEQGLYTFTPACILHYRKHDKSAMSNLKGLATGYTILREKIVTTVGDKLSFSGRLTLQLKTRKIMFFSFLRARKWIPALQYLIFGSI